ncbi:MAG: dTDP-4-dehydrorhamnose reductase [bacterium]
MKVLITGISGMLGVDLYQILKGSYKVVGLDLKEFPSAPFPAPSLHKGDITNLPELKLVFFKLNPDFVIHTAAYTDVDGCEKNPGRAHKVNALGTRNIALICQKKNIPFVYVSTDFVFDGKKNHPYTELDEPHPLNVYGKSKLDGENYVKSLLERYFIVRTSWLYGRHGKNFVDTILKLTEEKEELTVVDDQMGSPTYTKDLAQEMKKLLSSSSYGIYHLTNSGRCSWYEFAREILKLAGLREVKVKPITSKQLNRPARRPQFSVLKSIHSGQGADDTIRSWKEALKEYLEEREGL